jgi:hypothetical protein
MCVAHNILLDLFILIILAKEYNYAALQYAIFSNFRRVLTFMFKRNISSYNLKI